MLNLKTGYFKEFNNYRREEKLENSEHYGLDIDYERKNIFSTKKEHQDGVFTSVRYLNDIEYIILKEDDGKRSGAVDMRVEIRFCLVELPQQSIYLR